MGLPVVLFCSEIWPGAGGLRTGQGKMPQAPYLDLTFESTPSFEGSAELRTEVRPGCDSRLIF